MFVIVKKKKLTLNLKSLIGGSAYGIAKNDRIPLPLCDRKYFPIIRLPFGNVILSISDILQLTIITKFIWIKNINIIENNLTDINKFIVFLI